MCQMWILKAVLRNMLPVTLADKDELISTFNPHKKIHCIKICHD